MLPLKAHLERVLAENLRHVVGQLERRGDFVRRQEGVAAQRLEAADTEGRETAVFLELRNALNPELRRDVRQVVSRWRNAGRVQVVQARAHHVDQGRRERVGITQGALLRVRGLSALLEAAAVRYTTENTGNELRTR